MNGFNNEVIICGILYKYKLVRTDDDCACDLIVTPCNLPSCTFDCARITCRNNQCSEMNYYQAQINCDPVSIIQDCDLKNICRRCIETYVNCIENEFCGNTNTFGFF